VHKFVRSETRYGFESRCRTKVKLSLCLIEHHAMKTYGVGGGIAPSILNVGTRWK
jgi:hypothetical protein